MDLNGKYSIILYKWLVMNYNQYVHYQYTGNHNQRQKDAWKNPRITVEELRVLTDTTTDYKRFTDFEKKVLKQPLEEINKHTKYNVTYDKKKKGRKIDAIVFHIEKKPTAKDENYKERQQGLIYLESKEKKAQSNQEVFTLAMQSEYTKLLIENFLLSPLDMTDIDTMADLQRYVYPLYDELKELKGLGEVRNHLAYVARKQDSYSKSNIPKYLRTAVEQYLSTMRWKNHD